MLPGSWAIDNYRKDRSQWIRKNQGGYITRYEFDNNDDGTSDDAVETFTYALRYEHSVISGVIWLRNSLIPNKLRSKSLRVLMQTYIAELAGPTYEIVRSGLATSRIPVGRPHAAAIVAQGPVTVAGQAAYMATFDIADVDQIKLTPDVHTQRVQLVLMRAPQDEKVVHSQADRKDTTYPVIVLMGYSSMPADFQAGLEDFHDLLRRLTIDGKAGLTMNGARLQPPQGSTALSTAPPVVVPKPAPSTEPAAPPTAP